MVEQEKLKVAALQNGTVIDHIPSNRLMDVVNLLHLYEMASTVMIGHNLKSSKMGRKSLIKIADRFFTDEEISQLSVVAPNATLCVIRDYKVAEKRCINLPEDLKDIVKCANPKCITNNEPMATLFHIIDKDAGVIKCHYCEKEMNLSNVKLK